MVVRTQNILCNIIPNKKRNNKVFVKEYPIVLLMSRALATVDTASTIAIPMNL